MAYGNKGVLANSVDTMQRWIGYLLSCTLDPQRPPIVVHEEPGGWFLGDWAWPGALDGAPGIDASYVATYFLGRCASIVRDCLCVLGRPDEAHRYGQLHRAACDAINARFLDRSTMEYAGGIGAANAFALALNAVAAADRPPVRAALVRRYRATGALDTGIFGTPLLLDALSAAGATDLALALVRGPGFPSYGYMLEHGATTLWEHWDGRESHNHPMFGSVSEWFTERLAGLRCVRVARASDHVVVEPFAQDALGAAAMTYEGTRGRYQLAWTQQEGRRQLHLELPPGVIATVRCPGSVPWRARAGVFDLEWDRARDGDAVPARLAERLGWTPLGPPRS